MCDEVRIYTKSAEQFRSAKADLQDMTQIVASIATMLSHDPERLTKPNPNEVEPLRRALNETAALKIEPAKWPTFEQIVVAIRKMYEADEEMREAYEAIPDDLRSHVKRYFD